MTQTKFKLPLHTYKQRILKHYDFLYSTNLNIHKYNNFNTYKLNNLHIYKHKSLHRETSRIYKQCVNSICMYTQNCQTQEFTYTHESPVKSLLHMNKKLYDEMCYVILLVVICFTACIWGKQNIGLETDVLSMVVLSHHNEMCFIFIAMCSSMFKKAPIKVLLIGAFLSDQDHSKITIK